MNAVADWAIEPRLELGLYSLWLAVALAVLVLRPGELLQVGVTGVVGYVALAVLQTRRVDLPALPKGRRAVGEGLGTRDRRVVLPVSQGVLARLCRRGALHRARQSAPPGA